MKPSSSQVKWLWEWCGLEWRWNHNPECKCGEVDDDDSMRSWYTQDGNLATRFYNERMNDIEALEFLGFLFKHAVPKLIEKLIWGKYVELMKLWLAGVLF